MRARGEESVVVAPVERFDHLDRDQLVVRAGEIAVVRVQHRDLVFEAGSPNSVARVLELGVGDRRRCDTTAVRRGRMQRETAPTGANLEHVIGPRQIEECAHAVQLGDLGILKCHVGAIEDAARIHHRRVEHERVEIVSDVVVRVNVLPGSCTVATAPPERDGVAHRTNCGTDGIKRARERGEVAYQHAGKDGEVVALPPTTHVALAQTRRPVQQRGVKAPVPHDEVHNRSTRTERRRRPALVQNDRSEPDAARGLQGEGTSGHAAPRMFDSWVRRGCA